MDNTNQTIESPIENLEELQFSSKKVKESTIFVLADAYWDSRAQRRALQNAISQEDSSEDKRFFQYFEDKFIKLENDFKNSIKVYCQEFDPGRWALSQHGIGPLTVVRLLRYINITKTRSHEQLWAYAGLAPKSGSNQTYNSSLKDTCVDLGRSFIRHSGKQECFYGQLYKNELARRIELNDQGMYADLLKDETHLSQKASLATASGKLSLDRLRSQSQRYAVKIFLVHWYSLDYKETYGSEYITNNKNVIPIPN